MDATIVEDSHTQLRRLYTSLLQHQDQFTEFQQLLALYEADPEHIDAEPVEARKVREQLNARIREWIGEFNGLSATQTMLWRNIMVDERANVALSPWKESNFW